MNMNVICTEINLKHTYGNISDLPRCSQQWCWLSLTNYFYHSELGYGTISLGLKHCLRITARSEYGALKFHWLRQEKSSLTFCPDHLQKALTSCVSEILETLKSCDQISALPFRRKFGKIEGVMKSAQHGSLLFLYWPRRTTCIWQSRPTFRRSFVQPFILHLITPYRRPDS